MEQVIKNRNISYNIKAEGSTLKIFFCFLHNNSDLVLIGLRFIDDSLPSEICIWGPNITYERNEIDI
jgi:hypothetical protein